MQIQETQTSIYVEQHGKERCVMIITKIAQY